MPSRLRRCALALAFQGESPAGYPRQAMRGAPRAEHLGCADVSKRLHLWSMSTPPDAGAFGNNVGRRIDVRKEILAEEKPE